MDLGEDDRSVARHHDDMCREMNKARPDFDVVLDKLKCTVSLRKNLNKVSVAETLAKFPWLKNPKLVRMNTMNTVLLFITHAFSDILLPLLDDWNDGRDVKTHAPTVSKILYQH